MSLLIVRLVEYQKLDTKSNQGSLLLEPRRWIAVLVATYNHLDVANLCSLPAHAPTQKQHYILLLPFGSGVGGVPEKNTLNILSLVILGFCDDVESNQIAVC